MNKYIIAIVKAFLFVFVYAVAAFIINKYEYLVALKDIDNLVGMVPVVLILIFTIGATYLLFAKHTKTNSHTTITIAALVVISVALFPTALRGNWWINPLTSNEAQAAPDLTVYASFSKDSKTAKLGEKSSLQIRADMPILDGATALYPVYAAFAQTTYDEKAYSPQKVLCTNTSGAYKSVINSERDIIFVATASQKQIEAAKQVGVDLKFTPIGREAFVFLVGKENPIDDISYQQIRYILSANTKYIFRKNSSLENYWLG